jgi:hypothetical protein
MDLRISIRMAYKRVQVYVNIKESLQGVGKVHRRRGKYPTTG